MGVTVDGRKKSGLPISAHTLYIRTLYAIYIWYAGCTVDTDRFHYDLQVC